MVKSGKFVVSDYVKPGKQIVQLVEELFGIMHESDEEEAIITEGRVIAAKREMVKAVTGLLEAE